MNPKEIMQLLLEDKKIGTSAKYYMFLKSDGELQIVNEFGGCTVDEQVGDLFINCNCKIIVE
jgi:hypothetical protein